MTKRQKMTGFTLIELMFTVALLGVLATIGFPFILDYRGRSIRAESMVQMSALANSENAYYGERQSFTDDLSRVDWLISGDPRFLYGFTSDTTPERSGLNDTAELKASGYGSHRTGKMVDAFGIILSELELPDATVTADYFRIGAVGNIDHDPKLDRWTLDKSRNLINVTNDLENSLD